MADPSAVVIPMVGDVPSVKGCLICGHPLCVSCEQPRRVRPSSVSLMARDECANCGFRPMLPNRTLCMDCEAIIKASPEDYKARPTAGGQLLRVEKWKSGENREEVHYFIEGTQTYVMGFNPATVPEDVVLRALKDLGYKV